MSPRTSLFVLAMVLLVGCGHRAWIVDGGGPIYSEYYENVTYLEGGNLKIHALETLGDERLPEQYDLSESQRSLLETPDTIETVFEVYVTNNSQESVELTFGRFKSGTFRGSLDGEPHIVEAGEVVKTIPVVGVTSIYKAIVGGYELQLWVNGQPSDISGEMKRLTVEALRRSSSE